MERKQSSFLELANLNNPIDDYPIQDIVYLDQNYKTFKYFLTGKFNPDPDSDQVNAKFNKADSDVEHNTRGLPPDFFLKQLNTLTEKIKLYKEIFYNKSPRRPSYNNILDNKNLTFDKFK